MACSSGMRVWRAAPAAPWCWARRGFLTATPPLRAVRDAYSILGVNRTAPSDEIKAKFRELAKKYHPDLNKGDKGASVKMAELTTAYDTLTDVRKRAALDQAMGGAGGTPSASAPPGGNPFDSGFGQHGGEEWVSPSQMFSEFSDIFGRTGVHRAPGANVASRGEDATCQVDVPFLDSVRGCEKVVSLMLRQSCGDCSGTGAREGTSWSTCRVCKGCGVQKVERGILSMGVPCQRCQGTGEVLDHPCRSCRGEGTRVSPKDTRVNIPAGVRNLMELRIPAAGHAGSRGGKGGHLFVTVKVQPHDAFRRVDDDVHLDVKLTLKQALLGGKVEVPNLQGTTDVLAVKAPAQPGTTKLLRNKGPPRLGGEGRGHLVFHFLLDLPSKLSPRQVELVEEFDSLTPAGGSREEKRGANRGAAAGAGRGIWDEDPPLNSDRRQGAPRAPSARKGAAAAA